MENSKKAIVAGALAAMVSGTNVAQAGTDVVVDTTQQGTGQALNGVTVPLTPSATVGVERDSTFGTLGHASGVIGGDEVAGGVSVTANPDSQRGVATLATQVGERTVLSFTASGRRDKASEAYSNPEYQGYLSAGQGNLGIEHATERVKLKAHAYAGKSNDAHLATQVIQTSESYTTPTEYGTDYVTTAKFTDYRGSHWSGAQLGASALITSNTELNVRGGFDHSSKYGNTATGGVGVTTYWDATKLSASVDRTPSGVRSAASIERYVGSNIALGAWVTHNHNTGPNANETRGMLTLRYPAHKTEFQPPVYNGTTSARSVATANLHDPHNNLPNVATLGTIEESRTVKTWRVKEGDIVQNTPLTLGSISCDATTIISGNTITCHITAQDPQGIAELTARVDGQDIPVSNSNGTYTIVLSSLPVGEHTLTISATGKKPDGTLEAPQSASQKITVSAVPVDHAEQVTLPTPTFTPTSITFVGGGVVDTDNPSGFTPSITYIVKDANDKIVPADALTPNTAYTYVMQYTTYDGATNTLKQLEIKPQSFTTPEVPNTAPVANADTATTAYNTAVTLNVLANDTDANGDTLTIASFDATSANGGTITQSGNSFTYTPKAGFSGTDTFEYWVYDGKTNSLKPAVVKLNVQDFVAPTVTAKAQDIVLSYKVGDGTDKNGGLITLPEIISTLGNNIVSWQVVKESIISNNFAGINQSGTGVPPTTLNPVNISNQVVDGVGFEVKVRFEYTYKDASGNLVTQSIPLLHIQ